MGIHVCCVHICAVRTYVWHVHICAYVQCRWRSVCVCVCTHVSTCVCVLVYVQVCMSVKNLKQALAITIFSIQTGELVPG